ncbi:hypothetical protein ACFL4G_05330 [Thermodesulfobacteriota bacterium]
MEIFGINMSVFMKIAFEASLLGLFVVCLVHSWLTHGPWRTVREFTAGFFLTACCESIGVLSGAYIYPGFRFYVFATPVANPASWIATVYIIIEVTNRIVYGNKSLSTYEGDGNRIEPGKFKLFPGSFLKTIVLLSAIDALLALVIDLVLDPLATIYNWWVWVPCEPGVTSIREDVVDPYNFERLVFMTTPPNWFHDFFAQFFPRGMRYPTRLLGIPLINFIAWFVFVFTFAFEFRFVEFKVHWSALKKTIVLWLMILIDIPILAFLLITPNI